MTQRHKCYRTMFGLLADIREERTVAGRAY
jgi:hypothetical protein